MSKRATTELMDQLHALTAKSLADIITNGIPVFNKDTGEETGREPPPASYIAAAIKFLKDNDITADAQSDRFNPLADALKGLPTFDDGDDDHGRPFN